MKIVSLLIIQAAVFVFIGWVLCFHHYKHDIWPRKEILTLELGNEYNARGAYFTGRAEVKGGISAGDSEWFHNSEEYLEQLEEKIRTNK